jgi:hypothetical protein
MKIYLEWLANTMHRNLQWTLGITWFLGVGCTSRAHTRYKMRARKDWERPTKRAITTIIMQSDKASLREA